MTTQIDELHAKANAVFSKYHDADLRDLIISLAKTLQASDAMYHHFGHLLKHVRATVAHPSRPAHLQDAIERAQKFIKTYESERKASAT